MNWRRFAQSLSLAFALYGLFGWVYIVINSEVHMQTLSMQLTHFASWPHEDTFGEICFLVSFISFIIYMNIRDKKTSGK